MEFSRRQYELIGRLLVEIFDLQSVLVLYCSEFGSPREVNGKDQESNRDEDFEPFRWGLDDLVACAYSKLKSVNFPEKESSMLSVLLEPRVEDCSGHKPVSDFAFLRNALCHGTIKPAKNGCDFEIGFFNAKSIPRKQRLSGATEGPVMLYFSESQMRSRIRQIHMVAALVYRQNKRHQVSYPTVVT